MRDAPLNGYRSAPGRSADRPVAPPGQRPSPLALGGSSGRSRAAERESGRAEERGPDDEVRDLWSRRRVDLRAAQGLFIIADRCVIMEPRVFHAGRAVGDPPASPFAKVTGGTSPGRKAKVGLRASPGEGRGRDARARESRTAFCCQVPRAGDLWTVREMTAGRTGAVDPSHAGRRAHLWPGGGRSVSPGRLSLEKGRDGGPGKREQREQLSNCYLEGSRLERHSIQGRAGMRPNRVRYAGPDRRRSGSLARPPTNAPSFIRLSFFHSARKRSRRTHRTPVRIAPHHPPPPICLRSGD